MPLIPKQTEFQWLLDRKLMNHVTMWSNTHLLTSVPQLLHKKSVSYLWYPVLPTYAADRASNLPPYCRMWGRWSPEQWGWWHCCTQCREIKSNCWNEPSWVSNFTSWQQPHRQFCLWTEAWRKCFEGPLTICTWSNPLQSIQTTTELQNFCWYVKKLVLCCILKLFIHHNLQCFEE